MKYKNLSSPEARDLQTKYGKNSLPEEKMVSGLRIFISQFANPLVYALSAAGLISIFLQKYLDIFLIFAVVLANAAMGFFQEFKTQKTLFALKKLVKPVARVLRDGESQRILAQDLVPGDIVFLGAGDRVPADGKILEAASFFVNEAILTGESEPLDKKADDAVYMGTIVVSGRAVFEIIRIGSLTKIGEIAKTLKETDQPETTLQLRLKKMTYALIWIAILLSCLLFVVGFYTGRELLEMVELSMVIFVAIIPEALLVVITLILVLAMRDSLKRNALIRKILAVETLGSVTTICIDKTGTITEGNMRVSESLMQDRKNGLLTMCLCNDLNDTVEIALWEYLKELKDFDPQKTFDFSERVFEVSFGSEHKFMATVNAFKENDQTKYTLFVKGAPEIVLSMCGLQEAEKQAALGRINEWSEKGLKVLGLAYKEVAESEIDDISPANISGLEWNGMVGLWDPPRKEAKETFAVAKKSGLKIKVVTGDYHKTAEKVMAYLGMDLQPDEILEGHQMDKMTDEQMDTIIEKILLFARVTPQQKLRIVDVLQKRGEVVAMTGDGVNDAPALKKSNIGIVMGDAAEVAKETADMILLDSNFKTIISAVETGRLVFENIKKIIFFMLSNSFSEIVLLLGAMVMGWPLPITAVQILWLHLLCDGPEDFILGFEPKEKETMLDGPKRMDEPILDRFALSLIFLISTLSGALALFFFWYFGLYQGNLVMGQTMAFMSLGFSAVTYIFSCRTLRKPFWKYENFWSNKGLFMVVMFSLMLAVIITYLPITQELLNIVPLQPVQWAFLIFNSIVLVFIIEAAKYFKNKFSRKNSYA
jgi:Ca2+-transporting ATPase